MKKIFLVLFTALYICGIGVSHASPVKVALYNSSTPKYNKYEGGKIELLQDGEVKYTAPLQWGECMTTTAKTGDKTYFELVDVTDGTYDVRLVCDREEGVFSSDNYFYILNTAAQKMTVPVAQTNDIYKKGIRLKSSGPIMGGFTINYQDVDDGTKKPIQGATVTIKVDGQADIVQVTDANGQTPERVYMAIGPAYNITVKANGYLPFEKIETKVSGSWMSTDFTYTLEPKPVYTGETIKVSGVATIGGQTESWPAGLKLGITVPTDEGDVLNVAEVTAGKYAFDAVPRGEATFSVIETINEINRTAYEYRIKSPAAALTLGDEAEVEQDVDIERFASKIICPVTGIPEQFLGYAYLVNADDDTVATQQFSSDFSFRSVLPGTYTIRYYSRFGYGPKSLPSAIEVTLDKDETVPFELEPDIATLSFIAASEISAYNKYLDSNIVIRSGFVELLNEDKSEVLDTMTVEGGYFKLETQGHLGDKYVIRLTRKDIYPVETAVEVVTVDTRDITFPNIRFKPVPVEVLDAKGEKDEAARTVKLSWTWPEKMTDLEIASITVTRRLGEAEAVTVKTFENVDMANLPVEATDNAVEFGNVYTYAVVITYAVPEGETMTTEFDVDLRAKYMLSYKTNDNAMGEIKSAFAPGEYASGAEIRLTASPKEGYRFMLWIGGTDTISSSENLTFKLTQDTTLTAIFAEEEAVKSYVLTLKTNNEDYGTVSGHGTYEEGTEVSIMAVPKKGYAFVAWVENADTVSREVAYKVMMTRDRTLTAIFIEKTANEDLEANLWTVYAENGTLVIKGLSGDHYMVFDMAGRPVAQAVCTGAEVRLPVDGGKLYVVRRTTNDGRIGAKKIVVR